MLNLLMKASLLRLAIAPLSTIVRLTQAHTPAPLLPCHVPAAPVSSSSPVYAADRPRGTRLRSSLEERRPLCIAPTATAAQQQAMRLKNNRQQVYWMPG